jgi:Zn-dependent M28 family amino/carboxypeptidase
VSQAAARFGIESSPDPVPEQAVFIRSDHFRFVQQGIPSVMIATGFAGPGSAAYEDFLAHRYHEPTDDLSQAIDYDAGAKLVNLVHAIALAIADDAQQPTWNAGDFFGTRLDP